MFDHLCILLLAQDGVPTPDPSKIIDAAARGDVNGMLVAVAGVLLGLFMLACLVVWKLIQKIEAERAVAKAALDAADAACDAQRDKHDIEVRKLYGDLLKLSTRVQRAVEKMANITVADDEEG